MNKALFLIAASGAMLLSSCTTSKVASTTEYDDVYYSQSDAPEVIAVEAQPEQPYRDNDNYVYNADRYRQSVDNYSDELYDEDDFYFSRRVRRFNNAGAASWRYYDPYFSNDLYFVMGTPAWNTWNNNGWYNWNYPRFGATYGWNTFGGVGVGYNPYFANSFNQWNNFNYYNPYVNAYYGYDPFFSPGFGNPYAVGFNNGFNAGFGSAYYCPPYGAAAAFGNPRVSNFNRNNTANVARATYRRPTTAGAGGQTNYTPGSSVPNKARTSPSATTGSRPTTQGATAARATTTSNNSRYLQPRPATERATRTAVPATYSRPTATPSSERATGRTATTNRTSTNVQTTTRQPRVYTQPSRATSPTRTNTQRNSTRTATPSSTPRRTYTRPSSSNTPSRTSSPSRVSTPSRSSSPARTSSPSRTSSPASSSRPSSSRRP